MSGNFPISFWEILQNPKHEFRKIWLTIFFWKSKSSNFFGFWRNISYIYNPTFSDLPSLFELKKRSDKSVSFFLVALLYKFKISWDIYKIFWSEPVSNRIEMHWVRIKFHAVYFRQLGICSGFSRPASPGDRANGQPRHSTRYVVPVVVCPNFGHPAVTPSF